MAFHCVEVFVTLATVNIENLVSFYSDFLGREPINTIGNVYAEFQLSGLKIGIFRPKNTHILEFETSNRSTMSLCLEVNDLVSAIAHLTALGYPPPGEIINASHGQEIYAYDPDGNRLILHQSH
jgi:catechol 2,3-dioxygenase-like lactoylglutathione lyase family enzyme